MGADVVGNRNAAADRNTNRDRDCNGNANRDRNVDCDTNVDADTNPNADRDRNTNRDRYRDANPNAHPAADDGPSDQRVGARHSRKPIISADCVLTRNTEAIWR